MKSVSIGWLGIGDVHPPHRDGDDLRARRLDRRRILLEALVLAGADDQPRGEGPAGDGPGVRLDVLLRRHSAASHEMHDLKIVAVLDAHSAQRRARHDLEVALDRDAQRIEPELG